VTAGSATARPGSLSLLASAISGRALHVSVGGPSQSAWTDGTVIFVPADASKRDQLEAVVVQASLIAAGSLDFDIARRLSRRPDLAWRYLSVEGHRALSASENLLPPSVLSLIDKDAAACADTPAQSLAIARSRGVRLQCPPPSFGVIRPRKLLAVDNRLHTAGPLGEGANPALRKAAEAPPADGGADDPVTRSEGSRLDLFTDPAGGGAIGRRFQRFLRTARDEAGGGPLWAGPTASTRVATGTGSGLALTTLPGAMPAQVTAARRRVTRYPEWDVYRGRYRMDWCSVHETPAQPTPGRPAAAYDGRTLRRSLARLGMGLDHCRRQASGDEVDVDAAIQARADAAAGAPSDDCVYIDTVRRRRDLAALVLLDISGSAAQAGAGGTGSTVGETVHEQQRAAAGLLTAALHSLGDRVALYGFWSQGRSAVHLVNVKSFSDGLDALVLRRLDGLVPAGYTRLGAAIRASSSILEERGGTSRRLLVVLSDGLAYDRGYERQYGEADARRALAEARHRGTGCVCISVGAGADLVSLSRVFGTAAHASIPRQELLVAVVGPLFRAALRSAERRGQTWQGETATRDERITRQRSTA